MKSGEQVVAEACRLEIEEKSGRVFIVFEVLDEKLKQNIKTNWTDDIEYRLVDKKLVIADES